MLEQEPKPMCESESDIPLKLWKELGLLDKDHMIKKLINDKFSSEKEKSFWPYDGVSIFSSDGLRVLVLGQMSTRLNNQLEINTAPDALSFTLHSTVMQIVLNPYDIPELWRTEITYFPPSHYQW